MCKETKIDYHFFLSKKIGKASSSITLRGYEVKLYDELSFEKKKKKREAANA